MSDQAEPNPDECPRCGVVWNDEADINIQTELHIDIQCGFVAIMHKCECGKMLERFYDWDRTEVAT